MEETINIAIPLCLPVKERYSLPRCPGVYKIVNPNGEVYIGGTTNVFKRYGQYSGDSFKGQPRLLSSFQKYGKANHIFSLIEECPKEKLREIERKWSLAYNVIADGLNYDITGDGAQKLIRHPDVLRRIGLGHKGKPIHPNCQKAIIKAVKGKKQSPEHIEKRKMFGEKNPMFGKTGYWKGKHIPKYVIDKLRESRRRFGSKNSHARKVINIETGEIYGCVKDILPLVGLKYRTLLAQLQGRNKNSTKFKYL